MVIEYLYGLLKERLPQAAIVSIAHRPAVAMRHDRKCVLNEAGASPNPAC